MVEKDSGLENSLVVGAQTTDGGAQLWGPARHGDDIGRQGVAIPQPTITQHRMPTPSPSPDAKVYPKPGGLVREYVEVFDYAGGLQFRGFVAEKDDERALLVFFDKGILGADMKPGCVFGTAKTFLSENSC